MSTADSSFSVRCPGAAVLLFLFLIDKYSSGIPTLPPSLGPILPIVPVKWVGPDRRANLLKRICVNMADAIG